LLVYNIYVSIHVI